MTHTLRRRASVALILAAASFVPMIGGAQLPNPSVTAFGLAGNYSAAARGYDAVVWNPANLGLNTPAFSLSLVTAGGSTGLDPVKLSDVTTFQGKVLPTATKEAWLQAIGAGTERGSVDGGLSLVALSISHVGLELGLTGTGRANLNQDAAEAILFGNAGRTGTAKNLSFNNSNASGSAFATGAVSLGLPLFSGSDGQEFSVGVTGKYIRGLATGRAVDNGSSIAPSAVNVQFPMVYTDSASLGNAGSGFGVDVGMSWSDGTTTVSATARNVVNTFAWSTSALRSRIGSFTFDGVTNSGTFEEAPYANAPASLRAAIQADKFAPEIAFGVAYQTSEWTLTADAGDRIGDGIEIGPKMHAGAGVELTALPILRLRAGGAIVTDGYQAAGGVGLHLGHVDVGVAVSTRARHGGQELGAMVSLMSIR